MLITIPISTGELIDKITILEIKLEHIEDTEKKDNIKRELEKLRHVRLQHSLQTEEISQLSNKLREVNLTLWEIEDKLRIKEQKQEFDEDFIQLARLVYITNDKRAALKKRINLETGSELIEEKLYQGAG